MFIIKWRGRILPIGLSFLRVMNAILYGFTSLWNEDVKSCKILARPFKDKVNILSYLEVNIMPHNILK